MKGTSIIKYDDDDDDRSPFHRPVKETSIIKYDDDDISKGCYFTDL